MGAPNGALPASPRRHTIRIHMYIHMYHAHIHVCMYICICIFVCAWWRPSRGGMCAFSSFSKIFIIPLFPPLSPALKTPSTIFSNQNLNKIGGTGLGVVLEWRVGEERLRIWQKLFRLLLTRRTTLSFSFLPQKPKKKAHLLRKRTRFIFLRIFPLPLP